MSKSLITSVLRLVPDTHSHFTTKDRGVDEDADQEAKCEAQAFGEKHEAKNLEKVMESSEETLAISMEGQGSTARLCSRQAVDFTASKR